MINVSVRSPVTTNVTQIKPPSNNITTPSTQIIAGKDGDSAYDIAVKHGYRGSVTQWLDSLKMRYSDLSESDKQELLSHFESSVRIATEAQWNAQPTYIPNYGQMIVFLEKHTGDYAGIKIGDGMTYIVDLPFVGDYAMKKMDQHIADASTHVSELDRLNWNNKITCQDYITDGEQLVFTRC